MGRFLSSLWTAAWALAIKTTSTGQEVGVGRRLSRYAWTAKELGDAIEALLADKGDEGAYPAAAPC